MEYGRSEVAGRWPRSGRRAAVVAVAFLLVVATLIGQWQYDRTTAMQRIYLPMYLRATILAQLGVQKNTYAMWTVTDRNGKARFAVDADVAQDGLQPLVLSGPAVARGVRGLVSLQGRYMNQEMMTWFQAAIFDGQRVRDLALPLAITTAFLGVVVGILMVPIVRRHGRERRQGRWLRGTEFVSNREFTKRVKNGSW